MINGFGLLASVVCDRLAPLFSIASISPSGDPSERSISVELERMCFVCWPGLVSLERHDPQRWPPHPYMQQAFYSSRPLFDMTDPMTDSVRPLVLNAKVHWLHVIVEVTKPRPCRYDRSGKWKQQPPSKRKRMTSWRRASDQEKLRYAPLAGRSSIPRWARHPDAGLVDRLGHAEVRQQIYVYAQDGAPIADMLERHSREWLSTVMEGLMR